MLWSYQLYHGVWTVLKQQAVAKTKNFLIPLCLFVSWHLSTSVYFIVNGFQTLNLPAFLLDKTVLLVNVIFSFVDLELIFYFLFFD